MALPKRSGSDSLTPTSSTWGSDMAKSVYAFYYLEQGSKRYFYVGRSIDVLRRMGEHEYHKRRGHEDKYEFIREIEAKGIDWSYDILQTCSDQEYLADAEQWHVIRLTREGHDLKNMRHGSAEYRKELAEQIGMQHIRSAADVRTDHQRRKAEQKRRKYLVSRRRARKVWISIIRTEGIPSVVHDTVLPPLYRRRLQSLNAAYGYQDSKISRMQIRDFIGIVRTSLSGARSFKDFRDRIFAENPAFAARYGWRFA